MSARIGEVCPNTTKVRFPETTASVLLDAIRGIAAILVLLEHWRNAFFLDFPQIDSHRSLLSAFYLFCGAGHQAAVIFFVLSGYLISGSVFRAFQREEWSWTHYLTHRPVRLWIVLVPALLLGACWDQLGIHSHQAMAMYSGANYNHITPDVRHALSFKDFLGNVAFLQTITVPTFGSNGALWSLANEFWYYLLFPLAACIVGRVYKKPGQVVIGGLIFCCVGIFLMKDIWLLFPVWLLGALLHAVRPKPTALWLRGVATVAYAGVFFGVATLNRKQWLGLPGLGGVSDLMLGIATSGFIWILLGVVEEAKQTAFSKASRLTARFSFTLYVSHTPILTFLVALMAQDTRWMPTLKTGSLALIAIVVVVAYAWLVASLTEFKTDRARAWVESKMIQRRLTMGKVFARA